MHYLTYSFPFECVYVVYGSGEVRGETDGVVVVAQNIFVHSVTRVCVLAKRKREEERDDFSSYTADV